MITWITCHYLLFVRLLPKQTIKKNDIKFQLKPLDGGRALLIIRRNNEKKILTDEINKTL